MQTTKIAQLAIGCLLAALILPADIDAQAQGQPAVQIPNAGVPEVMTMEGRFVRAAYNNEGYAILGYQLANRSLGEEWMLLEVGIALRERMPPYTITRAALSLETPDGQTIPLATVSEYRKANLAALRNREKIQRDSINYFPPSASQACRIGFFSDIEDRAMPWDEVELSSRRGCVGRLFFQVPGGIKHGQYWLNVKFKNSLVRVPFRILTEDEERLLSRNFKDIRKQVEEAFKPKN